MMEYTNSQIEYLISEYIHSKRNREILHLRLIDGLTYEQISESVDMSVRQVKNIIYKEQDKVFRHMI
jgi:DNA-directed RNA polymerase specialized sigma24 family protein